MNTVYIYTLSVPIMNISCFVEALKFDIPTSQATYPKNTPRYIKNLFEMPSFADSGYAGLKKYMTKHDNYEFDESYSDKDYNLTPPYVSPEKLSRKRKEKGLLILSGSQASTSNKRR